MGEDSKSATGRSAPSRGSSGFCSICSTFLPEICIYAHVHVHVHVRARRINCRENRLQVLHLTPNARVLPGECGFRGVALLEIEAPRKCYVFVDALISVIIRSSEIPDQRWFRRAVPGGATRSAFDGRKCCVSPERRHGSGSRLASSSSFLSERSSISGCVLWLTPEGLASGWC